MASPSDPKPPLERALDALSQATNASELITAHNRAKRAIVKARAAVGPLAQTYTEAMTQWDRQKAEGVSIAERITFLGRILRAAWPQSREEPWHYLCERCGDTGWEPRVCTPEARCGRPFRLPGAAGDDSTGKGRCGPEHNYVVACWCQKGQAFRRTLQQQPRQVDPARDYAQAGKSKKLTRVGR